MAGNVAALDAMGPMPAELAASLAKFPLPRERVRRDAVDIDRVHKLTRPLEADVLRACIELLAVHPRVVLAWRQNSGSASYEAKSGKWAPVHFYSFIRCPEPVTLPDIVGLVLNPQGGLLPLMVECKREGWAKPTDDRERRQAAILATIRRYGGIGIFATSAADVARALG